MYVPRIYKGMLGEFINPLFFGGEGWVGVGKGLQKESAKNKVWIDTGNFFLLIHILHKVFESINYLKYGK